MRRVVVPVLAILSLAAPALAQKITVKAATPSAASQGTVNFDVVIDGSGFGGDSVAAFHVSGTTNPGGVKVNRTTRLSNSKVVANIDIDNLALLSYFDVKVLSGGRTGKGTDLFQVIQKNGQVGCEAGLFRLTPPRTMLPANSTLLACGGGSGYGDCAFGDGGITVQPRADRQARDSAFDALGRLLVLSTKSVAGEGRFQVQRFLADGTVDWSYGLSGVATVAFTGALDLEDPRSLAVAPDGSVVAVGWVPSKNTSSAPRLAAVVRFRPDGTPDPAFGTGGRVTFSFGSSKTSSRAFAVAVQPDGFTVIAGTADDDYALARLTPVGGIDSTFGSGGRVIFTAGTGGNSPINGVGGLAVQHSPAGAKLIVSGQALHCTQRQILVTRHTMNGALDTTFGARGDGRVFIDMEGDQESAHGLAVDAADGILVSASHGFGNASTYVIRLQPDGLPDPLFGSGGAARIQFEGVDTYGWDMARAVDGRILVGGQISSSSTVTKAFVVRLLPDGTVDSSFGSNGVLLDSAAIPGHRATTVAVGMDGRISVSGWSPDFFILLGLLP